MLVVECSHQDGWHTPLIAELSNPMGTQAMFGVIMSCWRASDGDP